MYKNHQIAKSNLGFSVFIFKFAVEGVDPVRREKLIELLDIDLQWRMHKVSDGQRRRVQICMGLLHPFKVFWLHLAYNMAFNGPWM